MFLIYASPIELKPSRKSVTCRIKSASINSDQNLFTQVFFYCPSELYLFHSEDNLMRLQETLDHVTLLDAAR